MKPGPQHAVVTLNGHRLDYMVLAAHAQQGWIEVVDSFRRVPALPVIPIIRRGSRGDGLAYRRLYGDVKISALGLDIVYARVGEPLQYGR